jgi:hypothetical protein
VLSAILGPVVGLVICGASALSNKEKYDFNQLAHAGDKDKWRDKTQEGSLDQ